MTLPQNSVKPDQRMDQILEKINTSTKSLRDGNERSRQDVISACFRMIQELEAPSETIVRMTWQQPSQLAAVETAVDLNLLQYINSKGSAKSITELAKSVQAEPTLVARILRVMASVGIIRETATDEFASAPFSLALEDPLFASAIRFKTDFAIPANLKTPAYLRDIKYQNPANITDTPMQFVHGSRGELNVFQLLHKVGWTHGFENMMKVWTKGLKHWSDDQAGFYPFQQRLIEGARKDADEVFLLDIAGGQGNDIVKLLALHPQETLPGRLVLQDLPQLIDSIPSGYLPEDVQAFGYDFFTPQPIKGARAYFMHSIIHDHADDRARIILKHIADVMEPGYSKLLIWDMVLLDRDVPPFVAAMDWEMMTYVAGHERSEKQWRALLEDPEVGMKVTGIWHYSQYDQSIIEAELA